MTGIEALISQMKVAQQQEHEKVYGHLFAQYGVENLHELKQMVFDGLELVNRGQSMNTYAGKIKDGVTISKADIAFICDYNNYGYAGKIEEDGTFMVSFYVD